MLPSMLCYRACTLNVWHGLGKPALKGNCRLFTRFPFTSLECLCRADRLCRPSTHTHCGCLRHPAVPACDPPPLWLTLGLPCFEIVECVHCQELPSSRVNCGINSIHAVCSNDCRVGVARSHLLPQGAVAAKSGFARVTKAAGVADVEGATTAKNHKAWEGGG